MPVQPTAFYDMKNKIFWAIMICLMASTTVLFIDTMYTWVSAPEPGDIHQHYRRTMYNR